MADKTAKKSTSSKTESSTAATTDSSSASDSSAPAEKASSGAASAGGSSAVHYGFFSNVKTPAYRSGWDSIWGKEDKKPESTGKPARRKPASGKAAPKKAAARRPVTVELTLEDLPKEVRDGLIEAAKAKLKGSRVSYDRRAQSGAVDWQIACEVRR
jgi:hypothetical protein